MHITIHWVTIAPWIFTDDDYDDDDGIQYLPSDDMIFCEFLFTGYYFSAWK